MKAFQDVTVIMLLSNIVVSHNLNGNLHILLTSISFSGLSLLFKIMPSDLSSFLSFLGITNYL